jgi:membrane fusion protein (multidrug efflux system)
MFEDKKKLLLIIVSAIIILPILFNMSKSLIMGLIMSKMRNTPPVVDVAPVIEREIYTKTESAGRLEAKYTVDVVARINGWLQKRYFEEGAQVKKGQTLFLIEPNEYSIAVQNAKAALRRSQAALINSEKELKRADALVKGDYVSKSYYDAALATRDQNKAQMDVSQAQLSQANLNLSYTRVSSPIDGKIGKIMITEGNLVNPQTGPLARIVSTTPIYAYFNLKSEDFLKFKKSDTSSSLEHMQVQVQLADGSIYPYKGKIEFVNNEVDPSAGTIALRASLPNENNLLVPGDYIKVIASSTIPRKVIVAPQSAVSDSTQGYYVWFIDKEGKAQMKVVKVSDQIEQNWVIEEGLEAGDVIIVSGIQSLKPGIKVKIAEKETGEEIKKKDKL